SMPFGPAIRAKSATSSRAEDRKLLISGALTGARAADLIFIGFRELCPDRRCLCAWIPPAEISSHLRGTGSRAAVQGKNPRNGPEQNREIARDGPIARVIQVKRHAPAVGRVVAAAHLPEPGYAGTAREIGWELNGI